MRRSLTAIEQQAAAASPPPVVSVRASASRVPATRVVTHSLPIATGTTSVSLAALGTQSFRKALAEYARRFSVIEFEISSKGVSEDHLRLLAESGVTPLFRVHIERLAELRDVTRHLQPLLVAVEDGAFKGLPRIALALQEQLTCSAGSIDMTMQVLKEMSDLSPFVEFGHWSWMKNVRVKEELEANRIGIVLRDVPKLPGVVYQKVTSFPRKLAWLRLLGRNSDAWFKPERRYDHSYTLQELLPIAKRIYALAHEAGSAIVIAATTPPQEALNALVKFDEALRTIIEREEREEERKAANSKKIVTTPR